MFQVVIIYQVKVVEKLFAVQLPVFKIMYKFLAILFVIMRISEAIPVCDNGWEDASSVDLGPWISLVLKYGDGRF